MRKREIRADSIFDEGDFYRIETRSTKGVSAIAGGILGTLVAPGVGTMIGGFLGVVAGQDGKVNRIPKSDITEIIEDSSGHIRVVVNDDRREGQA